MTPELLTTNLKNLCEAILASGQIKTIQDATNLIEFYNEAIKHFITIKI